MRVWSDGAGNQRARMEQIESRRYELADFIPKKWQVEERAVRDENHQGKEQEK